jgi:hypothetical protein
MATLDGRLARLEAAAGTSPAACPACGLPHAGPPIPLAIVEALVGAALGGLADPPPLCLCSPCCDAGRTIAWLSRRRPLEEDGPWRPR